MRKPEEGEGTPSGEIKETESKSTAKNADGEAMERRKRFAEAMARAAFGRFYWDERLDAEMRRTMNRAKRPKN